MFHAMMTDQDYMRKALQLAKKGERFVSPNPMVGSVIVKHGRIIAEGYHERCGANHAEINAIENASESVDGSTVYVNLEPCVHWGRTSPCTAALISHHVARVVIGAVDPNPIVSGRGIKELRRNSIQTTVGVLANECERLNERFYKFMRTGIPFVTLKFAQTLDGRIATSTGHSSWISSPPSLQFAHHLRSIHDAVLVGVGTVMADDPDLTVRLIKGRNPLRVIVAGRHSIPLKSKVLQNQDKAKTIIATAKSTSPKVINRMGKMGIETLRIIEKSDHLLDLRKLLRALGKRGITSILIEGGSMLITSIMRERLADRVIVILAPKFVGRGVDAVGELGIKTMDDALQLQLLKISHRGGDIIFDGRLEG
jgi:diaminohydroxyphosphoribosylaminopyrimidine deaminase/5-amino-6-(5-phosphoribosylamino)uracil reductase